MLYICVAFFITETFTKETNVQLYCIKIKIYH